jgi:hypothetical protein
MPRRYDERQLELDFDFSEVIALAREWREQRSSPERDNEPQFIVDGAKQLGLAAAWRALREKLHFGYHCAQKQEKAQERVRAAMGRPLKGAALLDLVGPHPEARYVMFYCADAMNLSGDKYYEEEQEPRSAQFELVEAAAPTRPPEETPWASRVMTEPR